MKSSTREEIPAVGNRVYTNDVRLRGRRGYLEIENHRVKSSTREGGFCLCRRGFNRRVFWVFLWMGDRVFGLIGRSHFWVDGRSGFLWMGRSHFFVDVRSGFFCGCAIGFLVDGRSGFWIEGRSNLIC
ncbi:MAG: hypothetical protein P2A85_06220 [Microcoleus anatoxicus]|uniref:hypothetical protein n=1 Tax=Microcoleus anatoxicus TaxID=2705319 RepID=UPI00366F0612